MKQSTSFAQVATNLLTVLQGYSKTIRLLLVMFLTLTVSANAWGEDYELVSFSDIKTNDVIIIVGTKSGTAYAMKNTGTPPTPIKVTISNSKITSTATNITFTATNNGDNTITFVSTNSGTLYCTNENNGVKIGSKTGDDTKFSFDSSVKRLKNIGQTRWLGIYNTQDWRCYTSATQSNIAGTTTTFYRKVTAAPSHTITATSNNNSYGTVSVSGTTITATPNAGYRVKSGDAGYTVTSGTAVVTNNGNNTFSVTPSSNCTITINFEAIPKYTVTWNVNGEVYETTQVTEGIKPTFPATPSSCDATSTTFYGWTTATWDGKINDVSAKTIYTSANDMPAVNGAVTYYAVFAKEGTSGSGTAGWSTVTSTNDLEAEATYAISSAATGGNYLSTYTGANNFPNSTTTICKLVLGGSEGAWTFKINDASYYNNYYLTATSTTDKNYLKAVSAVDSYCKFTISFNSGKAIITCTGKNSRNVLQYNSSNNPPIFACYASGNQSAVYLQKYSTGSTTTYSDYITTCTTEPSQLATPTGLNVSNITSSGATLSWIAVANASSYIVTIVDEASLKQDYPVTGTTKTFDNLTPSTDYLWTVTAVGDGINYTNSEESETGKFTTLNVCTDAVTISKGTETNGTFTLSITGQRSTCNGPVTVTLSNIQPASGYQFSEITQTGINTGVTINNTEKTVTYAKNTTGTSTINVTFIEIPKYTVTLNPNYPNGETGTFKDKDGNTVSGNLVLTYDYNTASMSLTDLYQSIELEGYRFNGWYSATSGGSKWTSTGIITKDVTVYAQWSKLHTVTFNTGTNNPTVDAMEGTSKTGITLPAGPTPACSTDSWEFAGWWTESVAETTTSPGELLTAGSNYKPTEDCTLYAVYSKEETEEGGGTTPTEATLSFASTAQRTSFSSTQQVWEQNGIILTNNKSASTSPVADYSNPARFYASSEIIIEAPGNITKIVFDCNSDSYATAMNNSIISNTSLSDDKVTLELDGTSDSYTISSISAQVRIDALTVTYLAESGPTITTTYNSNPSCEVCENTLTINKGAETNGTFLLSQSDIETCDGVVEVVVTPTPAEHHSVASVTATTPTTTGDAPTVTNNGNGTWTVTYAQDSKGESTISVTFVEDAKASITLSELGVPTTDNTTYYVGETYTLPSTSSQSCDGKQLVGWSRVEVVETDTKPTENYYELGAEVTLAETQTFYAVFAQSNGGGGGNGDYARVTEALDDWSGDYLIAYNDQTFANGSTGGTSGMGAEGNKQDLSSNINNNTIPANIGDLYNVTLVTVDGGYVLQTKDNKYNYQSSNANGLAVTDNIETAKQYPLTVTFNNENDIAIAHSHGAIFHYNKNQTGYFRFYKDGGQEPVYLYKKSGSSATYTAYTTSCVPTYSITYDFAGGTGSHCSNTSVPQGDPYTICEEEPIKEGHTFQGWLDGTSTYAAGTTITPTKNTTLTAQWQINTYTVTWSNNGVTTPVTYEHGDELEVLAAPESCDGVKEFVGWTTHSGYYHATTAPDDIFTTKTTPVTATATYYAVFATPPGTGGGGGGSETTTTLDFTAQEYADATAISNLTVEGVTATFDKGSNSNAPKYYTNGTAIRAYGGNTITLSANQITAATFTFGSGDGSNGITADCGSWDSPNWTGDGDATDEVVFTIGGTSGNRRIKSIAVTYTSGGGSGSYSDYTTTCQQVESIEVQSPQTEFYLTDNFTIGEGKVMATLSDGITEVDVTALATFSGYNMEVVGTYTVTVTYMGATATYNINVKPLDNAWVLTWNVSGKTNTGLGPRYVTKGTAIGTLPTPEVPAACAGKTFMGWTESNIVPSDGVGIEYITPETKPDDNTTYYAVFATVNNFCTQKPIDQITSGSKVVIVAVASLDAGGTTGKAISSRTSDDGNNLAGDEVSIYDNTINTPHSTCIWTLYKDGEQYYFKQGNYFLNAVDEEGYTNLKWNETKELWNITSVPTYLNTYYMESTHVPDTYIEWYIRRLCFKTYYDIENENGEFDMQFFVTANANGGADITDYTTGCEEYTITYYGFRGGYSTSTSSDGTIVLPVNSMHTVPNCGDVVTDHTNLGREFLDVWMTQPHGGHTFKPGDTFILTQDTTLYAQWKMETTSDVTTLPTDIEDLAGTDIYVYGGTTLNIQPGTTTINSLTLKGGLQSDGSYKMPIIWVPEGATLVRNSNKIYLDLKVNAKNYYPFAVPFAAKNNEYVEYLDPILAAASTYGTHFAIKTYDGALRATNGEDRANNWVRVLRGETLQPGVGYIISAMTYSGKDTATIRIPMTVPNTWFENGEQAKVGTNVRNTIAVTAHTGAAATEHQRHAGWNFVASPYLTNFAGGNVANDGGLAYINGELIIEGSYEYTDEEVPYVTIPAYDFSYYTQHKLRDVKLSPEWSFFVQIGTGGTMNFTTAGRQETPASIAARHDAAQSFKMDVDITLSDKNHSDQMGLIICDHFSSAYEVGYDLEKMFGSAYNLTVYTLMEDNTPLAYHALAIHSNMQVIPVGYRVPEQGDYTFALNQSTSSIDLLNEQYEQLILVDYETGALTNLLNSTYTFTSPRTQSDSRFAIYAVIRQKTPTDLPNIDDGDTSTRKILHNGHLYILRDGKVYNGHGQIVK